MDFELTNHQRKYLGLDEVLFKWERVHLKAGLYQPESILYYEGNVIKKQIISTDDRYFEWPVNLATRDRMYLLPKTAKGKEKKLTAATLEKYEPDGVAFEWRSNGRIYICNHRTQIDYYNNFLEAERILNYSELENWLDRYIKDSPSTYLSEIEQFRNAYFGLTMPPISVKQCHFKRSFNYIKFILN